MLISFGITKSQIVINEIVASNFRNHHDEDYDDSDWLELYNKSDKPVNLKDWKIFDKNEIENAFILPDTVLHPKEKIVIFASGKNRYTSNKIYARTSGLGMMAHVTGANVYFLYLDIDYDFEAELKIDNIKSNDRIYSSAGILFIEDLDPFSKYNSIISTNKKRGEIVNFLGNDYNTYPRQYQYTHTSSPEIKLKLTKFGNITKSFIKYHNGVEWFELTSDTIDFNANYLGISFGGNDYLNQQWDEFIVSDFKINGETIKYNQLKKTKLGLESIEPISNELNEIHTNFSLSKQGESVFLWNAQNKLVDRVDFDMQYSNLSFSRYPDGDDKFYFSAPTPLTNNQIGYDSIILPPTFSEKSSTGKIISKIELYHQNPDVEIYYTLDGSEPTKHSLFFQNQILLDSAVTIRTKAFGFNSISYYDNIFTYKPEYKYKIPVFNFVVDTNILFDNNFGLIYGNMLNTNEITSYFDYIDVENDINYSNIAGIRLHGRGTRYFYPQTSFRFYHRNFSQNNHFMNFWRKNEIIMTKRFVTKNGGQDWEKNYLRDNFSQILIEKMGDLEYEKNKYVLGYINNQFYGLFLLKERIDNDFLQIKYGFDEKSNVNIMKENHYDNGDLSIFVNDILSKIYQENFDIEFIKENFDLENIIKYTFIRDFTSCSDWPYNNFMIWQCDDYDTKWRFIPNDFDWTFNFNHLTEYHKNTFKEIREYEVNLKIYYVLILFKLLEDYEFQKQYSNYLADQLNYSFKYDKTFPVLDSLVNIIEPIVPLQQSLYPESMKDFSSEADKIRLFLKLRPQFLFQHIVEEFNYSGTDTIALSQNIENAGRFQVNSIEITEPSWTGTYFNEVPISVSVKSNPGFRFIGWENLETSDSVLTDIYITQLNKFNALFEKTGEPIEVPRTEIVINEIMFRPAENQQSGDWIEIYNNGNIDVDLSNWQLKDDNNSNFYIIPEGTILRKNDFIILSDKPLRFREYYGLTRNVIGGFDFGFGEDDMVRLFDDKNQLIDIVNYVTFSPLTDLTNRTGNTLELIHPNLENNISLNWKSSDIYGGTPLENNSIMSSISSFKTKFNHYPNPVKDYLHIENYHGNIKINIYDFNGKNIKTIETLNSNISINFSEHNSGLYVIKILDINNNLLEQLKIIKK